MNHDQPARILVVDDVAERLRLLEALRTSRGYDVALASDGASALDLVSTVKPDLPAGQAALDIFSEWKSVYIDYSGKLQRAQIDMEFVDQEQV